MFSLRVVLSVGLIAHASPSFALGECPCDWNEDLVLNSQDFFDFLGDFFVGQGDYNNDGVNNSQDFFDFLNCFFSGCPSPEPTYRGDPNPHEPGEDEYAVPGGRSTCHAGVPWPDSRVDDWVHAMYPFSGEVVIDAVDMVIPGRGFDFVWARRYRSQVAGDFHAGYGWDTSYNIFVAASGPDLMLHNGMWREDIYTQETPGHWTNPEFFRQIELQMDGRYEVHFPNGGRWVLKALDGTPAQGKIESIIDRSGNTMTFGYDAQGHGIQVTDTLGRNMLLIWKGPWLSEVQDFTGRSFRYDYYVDAEAGGSLGDLKSVTSPAVMGTPNGNDYPNGKTTIYTYTEDLADDNLNHNLLSVTDPKQQTYLRFEYATTTDPAALLFDRVARETWGNAGDTVELHYEPVVPSAGNNNADIRVILNDRVGNVKEVFYDSQNRAVMLREFTGRANPALPTTPATNRPADKLRDSDPDFFETRYNYNVAGLITRVLYPNLNELLLEYDESNPMRTANGNLLTRRRLPGPLGGDQAQQVEHFTYLAGFGSCCGSNFVETHTDARGNVTAHSYDGTGNRIQTIHRIPSIVETFTYNPFGQMTSSLVSENGGTDGYRIEYDYFSAGPPAGYLRSRTTDPGAGRLNITTQYEYDAVGNVTAVISPRGHRTDYIRNALNQVVRTVSPQIMTPGGAVRYETDTFYDPNDNVARVDVQNVNDAGIVGVNTHFTTIADFDILNRPTRSCREKGNHAVPPGQMTCAGLPPLQFITEEFEYDANRNRTLIRHGEAVSGVQPANTVTSRLDERDLLFRATRALGDPGQATTQYDYDGNGNRVQMTQGIEDAAAPRITVYTIDGYNRTIHVQDPMGNLKTRHFDANGNITIERVEGELIDVVGSANNVRLSEVTYTHDPENRRIVESKAHFNTQTQVPIGDGQSTTTWEYDVHSRIVRTTNDNNHSVLFEYDAARRTSLVTDAKLNRVDSTYDANSNLLSTTETDKSDIGAPDQLFTTTHTYDALNRRITTTDNSGNTNRWFYDSRGNVTRMLDPLAHETRRVFDGVSRLSRTIRDMDADGADAGAHPGDGNPDIVTAQAWDDSSRLTGRTDDNANTTEYVFNPLGRRIAEVNADCTQSTSTFDVHGNVTATMDPNGTMVVAQYDLGNRCTHKSILPGPGVDSDTTLESYRHDGRSLTIRAQDDDSVVTATYDSLSMKDCETLNGEETTCLYDGLGNLLSCIAPGGRVTNTTHDELERPDVISEPDEGMIADYSYIGRSRVERRDHGNGTRLSITYDGVNGVPNPMGDFGVRRIITTRHSVIGTNANLDLRTYTWSRNGNKIARRDMRQAGPQFRHLYTYDAADRLVRTRVLNPANQTLREEDYGLDGVHNRTTVIGGLEPGAYTMVGDGCVSPGDQDMNQYTTTPVGDRVYDNNGNLTAIDPGLPTQRLMRYDYSNRMVEHEDAHTGVVSRYAYDCSGRRISRVVDVTGTPRVTRYYYHNHQVIEERGADEGTTATYVYGMYIDEALTMRRAGVNYYYHADDMFNVIALTNSAGTVVERTEFGDYGQPLNPATLAVVGSPSKVGNPYGFTGRNYDQETGLYWYRTRYLDPLVGRFTSPDSMGLWFDERARGGSTAYAATNPFSMTDPYGRSPAVVAVIEAAAVIVGVVAYSSWLGECMTAVTNAYETCRINADSSEERECCQRALDAGWQMCYYGFPGNTNVPGITDYKELCILPDPPGKGDPKIPPVPRSPTAPGAHACRIVVTWYSYEDCGGGSGGSGDGSDTYSEDTGTPPGEASGSITVSEDGEDCTTVTEALITLECGG